MPLGRIVKAYPLVLAAAVLAAAPPAAAQTVHAVLFHSPTCPHCRQVITQDLPVFFEVYGGAPTVARGDGGLRLISNGTLTILFADAATMAGGSLFDASYASHPVGGERRGVPRMIVGDSVMIGSVDIPTKLHGIIRHGLAHGGIPWPPIAGLEAVAARLEHPGILAPPTAQRPPAPDRDTSVAAPAPAVPRDITPAPPDSAPPVDSTVLVTTTPATDSAVPAAPVTTTARPMDSAPAAARAEPAASGADSPAVAAAPPSAESVAAAFEAIGTEPVTTVGERIRRDPVGNGMAIVALGLMVLTLAAVSARAPQRIGPREPGLWLPVLAVVGAGVAAYLTFIETSGATAVCGPVGDCNTVQQSAYARLFGVVPVGALGLAGYGVVLVLWVLGQNGRPTAALARRLLVAAALVGTLFSVYLTALEPFVIGATCLWCLTSAVVMTILLWLAAAWRDSRAFDNVVKSL